MSDKDKKSKSKNVIEPVISDFIPYSCHFDKNTILTKNGELLQVIKISGLGFDNLSLEKAHPSKLRDAVRKAISDNIKSENFSIWTHTIRRKCDISPDGNYSTNFSMELNNSWKRRSGFDNAYTNELYITVLISGEDMPISDIKGLIGALSFGIEVKNKLKFLESALESLNKTVDGLVASLSNYGAVKLAMHKRNDVYYSDILSFFKKLIYLEESPAPLAAVDLSYLLSDSSPSFGFNSFETAEKKFGAILTSKEHHDSSSRNLDIITQLPQEFIISESFSFASNKEVLEGFNEIERLQKIANDQFLRKASGVEDLLDYDSKTQTNFGLRQLSIALISDSREELEKQIANTVLSLQYLGVVVIREDVFMEDCFWSQLPGNFEFLKRQSYVSSGNICGYASLYNFPAGKLKGNHWGDAVTVFSTDDGMPYFFNFHHGDNGHTMILGQDGSGKTVLQNFLISEARKFNNEIYLFDYNRESEIFIRAIGGSYSSLNKGNLKLNPLLLDKSEENEIFLRTWLLSLISENIEEISDEDKALVEKVVELNFSLPSNERKLSNIVPKIWNDNPAPIVEESLETPQDIIEEKAEDGSLAAALMEASEESGGEIADDISALAVPPLEEAPAPTPKMKYVNAKERLSRWFGEGENAGIFDSEQDSMDISQGSVLGFDMTDFINSEGVAAPVAYYLIKKIEGRLGGSPSSIVLDEAWDLLGGSVFAETISGWLDRLKSKNCMVIFSTENIEKAEGSACSPLIAMSTKTQFFFTNRQATESYINIFRLSEKEYSILKMLDRNDHEFLLKHGKDLVVANLDFTGMDYELSVLSASEKALNDMEEAISSGGNEPEGWLPLFKEKISA